MANRLAFERQLIQKTADLAVKPFDPYFGGLHCLLTEWITDTPSGVGFSQAADVQAVRAYEAVTVLRAEELRAHAGRRLCVGYRGLVRDVARQGLESRLDHALTAREYALVHVLARAVVAGTCNAPDLNGVHGLRACRDCRTVFGAPRANQCRSCARSRTAQHETPEALWSRRQRAALVRRALAILVALPTELSAELPRVELTACERCEGEFVPSRADQRYCLGPCRSAAARARSHAARKR